jgi:hypothetical protein
VNRTNGGRYICVYTVSVKKVGASTSVSIVRPFPTLDPYNGATTSFSLPSIRKTVYEILADLHQRFTRG